MSQSRRGFLVILGTAPVLSTAGCLGSSRETPQSSPPSTATPGTVTQESSSQPPSQTTTSSSASDLTYPAGFSADGIEDIDQILAGHREYLLGRANYTERWTLKPITASGEVGSDQPTELIVRADPTAEHLHLRYHDHANNVEVFYDGTYYEYNVAEKAVSEGESPRLLTGVEKRYQPLVFWATNLLLPEFLSAVQVKPTGSRTVAGTTAITFTVTGVSETRKEEAGDVTFTGADGSVVVTESGGLQKFEYVPQFESESTSLQAATTELTDIGTTDVTRPEWVPR